MSATDQQRWDTKYAARQVPTEFQPDTWLTDCVKNHPPGRALDLACGLGHNAIWLSQQGWTVDAIDISPIGLDLAKQLATRLQTAATSTPPINWIAADLDTYVPQSDTYDLALVFRYLDRSHLPNIIQSALCPGGILVYETFTTAQLDRSDNHLNNPAFALASNELPTLFPQLSTVKYEESELDDRTVARLLARR